MTHFASVADRRRCIRDVALIVIAFAVFWNMLP